MMKNRGSTFPQIYTIMGVAWILVVIMIMVVMGKGGGDVGSSQVKAVQLSPDSFVSAGGNMYVWGVLLVLLIIGMGILVWGLVKGKKNKENSANGAELVEKAE